MPPVASRPSVRIHVCAWSGTGLSDEQLVAKMAKFFGQKGILTVLELIRSTMQGYAGENI